jgi:stage V sporulation protein K
MSRKRTNATVVDDTDPGDDPEEVAEDVPILQLPKRRRKLDAPPVNTISDLIKMGNSVDRYKNIDNLALWRITPLLQELDEMIGMEKLKESVFYQVIYYIQKLHVKNNEDYLHTVIMGAPGSGKTTVARIIGRLYCKMGILSNSGEFTVAHREDMVGKWCGHTADKTRALLESCIGGVLFIDEVYSLGTGGSRDADPFSKECLNTITAFLSIHKNDMCCIIAGYEDDIHNCFFGTNKGLERRFPWVHRIEPYTSNELCSIFHKMVDELGYETDFKQDDFLEDIFLHNKNTFKDQGGSVEVFITKVKMLQSKRVFGLTEDDKCVLIEKDLTDAIEFIDKNSSVIDDGPPAGMYM